MMLSTSTKWLLLAAFLCGGSGSTMASGLTCGQSKPDHHKICISVRLPWKPEPIYFCTDKENLKYERECSDTPRCTQSSWSDKTLLIATPWDCCPIVSKPSNCEHAVCPPKPFNRTCVTLKQRHSGSCCPMYFCEEEMGTDPRCNFKALEPGCHTPPAKKKNCVGFMDQYGCCTKYQCEGEGKPGTCPNHPPIYNAASYDESRTRTHSDEYTTAVPHSQRRNRDRYTPRDKTMSIRNVTIRRQGKGKRPEVSHVRQSSFYPQHVEVTSCIGDWNCPGDMKCCSGSRYAYSNSAASSYYPRSSEGATETDTSIVSDDGHAVFGYCTHPRKNEWPTPTTATTPRSKTVPAEAEAEEATVEKEE